LQKIKGMKKNEVVVVGEVANEAKVPANEEMSALTNAFADKASMYCKANPYERGVVLCFIYDDKTHIIASGSVAMQSMCFAQLMEDDDLKMQYLTARMVMEAK
jgi:hypothetical protein